MLSLITFSQRHTFCGSEKLGQTAKNSVKFGTKWRSRYDIETGIVGFELISTLELFQGFLPKIKNRWKSRKTVFFFVKKSKSFKLDKTGIGGFVLTSSTEMLWRYVSNSPKRKFEKSRKFAKMPVFFEKNQILCITSYLVSLDSLDTISFASNCIEDIHSLSDETKQIGPNVTLNWNIQRFDIFDVHFSINQCLLYVLLSIYE